jgi:hypothetical protein
MHIRTQEYQWANVSLALEGSVAAHGLRPTWRSLPASQPSLLAETLLFIHRFRQCLTPNGILGARRENCFGASNRCGEPAASK